MGTAAKRLTSPPLHRVLVLAIVGGLVLFWGLAVMGLSVAMAENDVDRWWVLPLFGIAVLILALIAAYLPIGTVKAHINHVFRKLSARNRTEAVARARELRLIE